MDQDPDAIVVGAGINGMAAAARLASAGWRVEVVERADQIGGFAGPGPDAARTVPGYRHDTFSSWHPLFVTGPVYAEFGEALHRHGLRYANTDGPLTATAAPDGTVTLAHRDPEATLAAFAEPADRDAYRAMLRRFGEHVEQLGALLGSELHSPTAVRPLWRLGRDALAGYLRDTATSGRSWLRGHFRGPEADRLWAPWLLHAGLSPDAASGGLMLPLFAATLHGAGLPVVVGGTGAFVAAWRGLLEELGVRIRTGHEVRRILLRDGRAVAVSGDGWTLRAGRAVLASVTPGALYGRLLHEAAVPERVREEAARFRPGRAAAQLHVALSDPVPWRDRRLAGVPLVHLSDGSASTGIACAEAEAGLLPRRPTVVVGQQHLLDPSRVPDGAAALWLQLQEMPWRPLGDAAGRVDTAAGWGPELAEALAGRVLDQLEEHAPGLRGLVRGMDVLTPADLLAHNPNAIQGDPYAGSAELDQNFLWRPGAGGGHRTPVPGLWHIGASTHPGPGLGGASGHLVAGLLLAEPGPLSRVARAAGGGGRRLGGRAR
jgi:phytoene dehydrogenase-like protein